MPCDCRQSFCPECGPGVEMRYHGDSGAGVLTVFDRVLAERNALRKERDDALLALAALCESCGGGEPHTLQACIAHLTKTLNDLPGLELAAHDAAHYREAYMAACDERDAAVRKLAHPEAKP